MEKEHIILTEYERKFLKRIIIHWRGDHKPLELGGYERGHIETLTYEEKTASRNLVIHDLVEVDIIPSTEPPPRFPDISFNMASTFAHIPMPQADKVPLAFNLLFTPTKKGLDTCFIEEI
jgi:hypothetical protein